MMKNPITKGKTRCRLQASNGSEQISLLPELDFNPNLPSRNTLASQALSMMLQGRKVSHPNFQNKTSSWRLAAHVGILKKLGWPIETIRAQYISSYKPRRRHIQRYFLNQKFIEKFKKISGGGL